MNWQTIKNEYRKQVQEWLYKNRHVVTQHVERVIVDLIMARDEILPASHFAQAIMENDLRKALDYGDSYCQSELATICKAYYNVNTSYLREQAKKKEHV